MPSSDMPSVRGIGVAVSVSTSTSARSAFSASFWRTPKRCSSSMMTRPRRLNFTSLDRILWVPMTMSTRPSLMPLDGRGDFLGRAEARQFHHAHRPVGEAVREGLGVLFGQQRGRAQQGDLLCHWPRPGRRRAARPRSCRSPRRQTSRSMGRPEVMSAITAWMAAAWSAVSRSRSPGKGFVVVQRQLEGIAFARGALRVQGQQLGGGVAHLLGGLAAGLVPLAGAQLVQRRGPGSAPL